MVRVKKHIVFMLLAMLILCITGCQKAPINGDLDGRWQLMEIETFEGVKDIADDQLYYSFYLHVCNLSYYGGFYTEGNFIFENNLLIIDFPYIKEDISDSSLPRFGIFSNPVEFKVVYLDKKKLIMENDESLITLRKF